MKINELEGEIKKRNNLIKKLDKKSKEIEKLIQENNEQKMKVEELNNHCIYLEKILAGVQFRILAKNFIRIFKKNLTPEDYEKIKKNPKSKYKLLYFLISQILL